MVCIDSTYYIKIHLLCDICDSVQAAGGMDSSILWPGKLWKTIVFLANKTRLIPGRSDHFYHCGKGQNQLIFYPIGTVPHCISSKKEPALLYQNRGQKTPHIWGPMQASRPSQHGDTPAYHPPQAAFLCRAVQRLAYTFMGSKGRFPFFGSTQIIQGFSPPVGLRPKK